MIWNMIDSLREVCGVRSVGDMILYGFIGVVLVLAGLFIFLVWHKTDNRDSN